MVDKNGQQEETSVVENTTTVSFDVPSELARLMALTPSQSVFERNAMLFVPVYSEYDDLTRAGCRDTRCS